MRHGARASPWVGQKWNETSFALLGSCWHGKSRKPLLVGSGYTCTRTAKSNRWVLATSRGHGRREDEKAPGLVRSPIPPEEEKERKGGGERGQAAGNALAGDRGGR